MLASTLWIVRQIVINVELRELVINLDSARSAVQSYRDRFGYLPGDDVNTDSRWGEGAPHGDGDGRISGAWLESDSLNDKSEPEDRLAWLHLRRARMWPGPIEGRRALGLPANAAGGYIGVQSGNFGIDGVVICLSDLDEAQASALDRQLDDGRPGTGYVRAAKEANSSAGASLYTPDSDYFLCRAL
ncbi:MAG: hypothetical protein H6981_04010 [Gammaproteobacteria bacterium]|nr:hypothetical protein [Gammaproteobacteria bacterium]MCP5135946.1 hypothetical protein [Gammaproteobacteria bacterium]